MIFHLFFLFLIFSYKWNKPEQILVNIADTRHIPDTVNKNLINTNGNLDLEIIRKKYNIYPTNKSSYIFLMWCFTYNNSPLLFINSFHPEWIIDYILLKKDPYYLGLSPKLRGGADNGLSLNNAGDQTRLTYQIGLKALLDSLEDFSWKTGTRWFYKQVCFLYENNPNLDYSRC